MTMLSRLLPCATSALALQLGLAAVFVPCAEDRFYDLSGAAGFVSTTLVSLYPIVRERLSAPGTYANILSKIQLAPRQLLLTSALLVWAGRLGSFLFRRAMRECGDSRLAKMKHHKGKFTLIWVIQAVWVFVVGLPVYMCNVVSPSTHSPLRASDFVGFALVTASFVTEVIADHQKSAWRAARNTGLHHENFITTGLWGISRHPNYVAEVGIWTGMWSVCALSRVLPWQAAIASAASPLFTYVLVRHVSGVPPLERVGDKKWGDDPKWKEYKEKVPIFFPGMA